MSSSQPGVPEGDEITTSYGVESRNSRIPRLSHNKQLQEYQQSEWKGL